MRQGADDFGHVTANDAYEMEPIISPLEIPHTTTRYSPREKFPGGKMDRRTNYAIGIALLLVVVLLWTSSSFLTQNLFEGGYEKPFLVTYMNTSAFSLYLVPYLIRTKGLRGRSDRDSFRIRGGTRISGYEPLSSDDDPSPSHNDLHALETRSLAEDQAPLTTQETAKLALVFCVFWFIANWSVNASLGFTTVASATVLSSMSGLFTLVIGCLFRVEKLTISKIGGVFTSITGVALVSLSDSSQPRISRPSNGPSQATFVASNPVMGDALALISAVFYAFYVTLLKVRIRHEARIDMQLFFGFLGLFNIIACWPIGILLHVIGAEIFELPQSRSVVAAILVNMGITLSSDYIYVLSMLKTTPLVVTVGLCLTIPLAVFGDFILGKSSRGQVIFGATLVLISFVVVGAENAKLQETAINDTGSDDPS